MTVENMIVLGGSWTKSILGKITNPILVGSVLESEVKRDTGSGEWNY